MRLNYQYVKKEICGVVDTRGQPWTPGDNADQPGVKADVEGSIGRGQCWHRALVVSARPAR
ncbi:hypothetical protein JCM18899A_52760 [Nocardioides sp. AN3]